MKSNRKGIALLWVVLTSALILVAIFGISMKVVPQKKIENSREYTQRALAVAETGLANVTYQLRVENPVLGPIKVALQSAGYYKLGPVPYNSGTETVSTYQVVIRPTPPPTSGYTFYSLGTVGPPTAPLARQAITVRYSGAFPIGEYALFTFGSINVQNGTVNGDVFANTSITVGNSGSLGTRYTAYCPKPGQITGKGIQDSQKDYNVRETAFPVIDIETYRSYWSDFLNGTGNYNGDRIDEGYPNTSSSGRGSSDVPALFRDYLGIKDFTDDHQPAAYQSNFDAFFEKVQLGDTPGAAQLRNCLQYGKMVFDVQPDLQSNGRPGTDVTWNQEPYKSAPYLEGTVIIEGVLKLTSDDVKLGDPARPSKTAILVTENVDIGNVVTINGLLYVMGTDKQGNLSLSFNAHGNLTCTGSIVAFGGIQLNSDHLTVTYSQNDIYDAEIKGNGLNPEPSSWRQISYDAFEAVAAQP